ncbi:uncharacterized protein N7482_002005 [Penicillium canariense]|uniref:Uncharacterized protein n=1 Tax=Penicillium canariense TaxID=189055 RepID=A0A9W9IG88_9EURO|nr:uncharacterized protein N7482_002005 [Penicillium canariense]KAJ5176128.1 hypothetical protein N7482_002005 [Penicillium canariense]
MSSIITAVKDLISSMFEVVFSVFRVAFDTASGLVTAAVNFFIGTLKMALHTAANTLKAAGGVGKFIASNIVVIALIAGGIYAYLQYQGRQGRPAKVGNKKLN